MTTPTVTELPRRLEPISPDTFIEDVAPRPFAVATAGMGLVGRAEYGADSSASRDTTAPLPGVRPERPQAGGPRFSTLRAL